MIWNFISEGGWLTAPILLCSILALAILLERALYWVLLHLRRDETLCDEILTLTIDRRRAERTLDPRARVLYAYVRHPEDPTVATALAERILRETRAAVPALHVVAGLACALGIFGTVAGASLAFHGAAALGPDEVARSLGSALVTTALGLIVYVTAYAGSSILRILTNRLALDLEQALNQLRQRLRSHSALGKITVTG